MKRITDFFRKQKIGAVFSVSFSVLITILFFLLMTLSSRINTESVRDTAAEYTQQLIKQVNDELNHYFKTIEAVVSGMSSKQDTEVFLTEADKADGSAARDRLQDQFAQLIETRTDVYNVTLINEKKNILINGRHYQTNPYADFRKRSWYMNMVDARGKTYISSPHVQNMYDRSYPWVVTIGKMILDRHSGEHIGTLLIDLNYSEITRVSQNIDLGAKGYVYIMQRDGVLVYHPRQQEIYSGLASERTDVVLTSPDNPSFIGSGKERRIYSRVASKLTDWYVVGVGYVDEISPVNWRTNLLYFTIGGLFLLFGVGVTVVLSSMIVQPIRKLEQSMLEVKNGALPTIEHPEKLTTDGSQNEVDLLAYTFYRMTEEIKQLMEANAREQAMKRKEEMRALQAQINPHFLYNTLDSIIWMAEGKKSEEVVQMTASLARLLKQSISNDREMVSIREEISYAEQYLRIQKMRYRDKLDYRIDVPDIGDVQIVKLVLQPLVENAIYHGLKYKQGIGTIRISAEREGPDLYLRVEDDGIGMKPDMLARIFEGKGKDNHGLGIKNVAERLKMYYGEGYGLSYESMYGIGTVASIKIPAGGQNEKK